MNRNAIFTFHEVNDPKWFEALIVALQQSFRLISLDEMYNAHGTRSLKGCACITFDDGELSFYRNALPVLEKCKIPVALFLSPGIVSGKEQLWLHELVHFDHTRLLNTVASVHNIAPEKLRPFKPVQVIKTLPFHAIKNTIRLYREENTAPEAGPRCINMEELQPLLSHPLVTIGAHTVNHPILQNETATQSREEIINSITILEQLTGKPIRYFAYPNGIPGLDFGNREKKTLAEAGINWAFSTTPRFLPNRIRDPYAIPRIGFTYGSPAFALTKLRFLPWWNMIRKLRGKEEAQARKQLYQLFGKHHPSVQKASS